VRELIYEGGTTAQSHRYLKTSFASFRADLKGNKLATVEEVLARDTSCISKSSGKDWTTRLNG